MPKSISKKDSRTVYCAYKVCENDKRMSVFSDIVPMVCQFVQMDGRRQIEYYGKTIQYTAVALFNVNENTKYINESTKLWFKARPVDTTLYGAEYEVSGKTEPMDGIIKVYLTDGKHNHKTLFVDYQGNVCTVSIEYDSKAKKGVIPKNFYFPFTAKNTFWERKPSSILDKNGALYIYTTAENENGTVLYFVPKE